MPDDTTTENPLADLNDDALFMRMIDALAALLGNHPSIMPHVDELHRRRAPNRTKKP